MNPITLLGISVIFFYSLIQILKFYGIGQETYGMYISFYIFLLISVFILPKSVE